ncbi:MAG TPA: sulfur carrier protein ThiS [Chthoniobacterales bacterium]|jgi:sulfur carrier protein|nr:sulfur carrier protein ThiS [Chthoniobacterales bacterium]
MKIWVNGEPADIDDGLTSVAELAARYGLAPNSVLIEHNLTALHQREWTDRPIKEGDRVEFVRVVAGG